MGTKWQKVEIDVPPEYGPEEREAIGQEMVDQILDRTKRGKDKEGGRFPGYTAAYKTLKQKLTGSSSPVDLTLTGDMLGAGLQVLETKAGKIVVGFEKGSQENAKADGNIRGTYGKPKPDPEKARDFLGVSEKEKQKILNNYPIENRKESVQRAVATATVKEFSAKIFQRRK